MPQGRISANLNSPTVGVFVDMGHPLLNRAVDGFFKIGTVGASRVAAEEVYSALNKGRVTKHDLEHTFKKMGKEGLQCGAVAGLYTGLEYGVERVRGRRDWKNALISGAFTGAILSLADNSSRDKMVRNAITGGAIATASEFIRYLT
ncbi:outer envelope pore protein 16, chloroplastic [Cryptomeria japonica]|uniref:outer envelope pore protein 16, chloroplastic n=1 Tax=Cryptomeria japonica TaxID=3369 RepID=UPI0025AC93BF|nr:outer envelope pore protein 16, chloroplastic [Cryptomeria japonica]